MAATTPAETAAEKAKREKREAKAALLANETKADKFIRLANARTMAALDAISNIGGLVSKTNYEYTPEQVAKIFGHLETEMTKLQERFKNPEAKEGRVSIL